MRLGIIAATVGFAACVATSTAPSTAADDGSTAPVIAAPLPDLWSPDFYRLRGPNAQITLLFAWADKLVATGDFASIGAVSARRIALWDGARWSPLADGLLRPSRSMVSYRGDLVVTDYDRIRLWNGSTWRDLGPASGSTDQPVALVVFRDELYAAYFASGIRRWTGSAWQQVGIFPSGQNARTLAVYEDALVAGGQFDQVSGVPANDVASWDGLAWRAFGAGITGAYVDEIVVYEGDLVVTGVFTEAGGVPAGSMARWNGTDWSAWPSGPAFQLYVQDNRLYGLRKDPNWNTRYGAVIWDGTSWDALDPQPPYNHTVTALHGDGDRILLGLRYFNPVEDASFDLAACSTTACVSLSPLDGYGLPAPIRAFTVKADTLFAMTQSTILRWTGSGWIEVPRPSSSFYFFSDLDAYDGKLVVGGSSPHGILELDSGWSPLGGGVPGWVKHLVLYGDDLIAAGHFGSSATFPPLNIARWDGMAWHPLAGGIVTDVNGVRAIATWNGRLVATARTGTAAGSLSAWDGATWTQLGNARYANGLLSVADTLYAAQPTIPLITTALARWDGTFWRAVPAASASAVLGAYGGQLVHGDYVKTGGTWARLGDGIDGEIEAIAQYRGSLWVGGRFSTASGKPSFNVARYDGARTPLAVEDLRAVSTVESVRLDWTLGPDAVRSVSGVRVQRAESASAAYLEVSDRALQPARAMSFVDNTVQPGNHYAYRLVLELSDRAEMVTGVIEVDVPAVGGATSALRTAEETEAGAIRIRYAIGTIAGPVQLAVFDVNGRRVRVLAEGRLAAGDYVQVWDRNDASGHRIARGVYFVQLRVGAAQQSRKLVLLRG